MNPIKVIGKKIFRLFGVRHPKIYWKVWRGEFKWLQLANIRTIIDVGANIGDYASTINAILPDAKIYSFEPLKECFSKLAANTKHIKGIECYNYALGDKVETRKIKKVNEYVSSSSFLPFSGWYSDIKRDDINVNNVSEESVAVTTLDSFFENKQVNRNIYLKIDVQGFELFVLNGAKNFLNKVDFISIETSFQEIYKGQPLFNDIYSFMYSNGFIYSGSLERVVNHLNTGMPLQEDVLFVNRNFFKN